ncbi:uncharacterized protein LOC107648682 [Arachis ipaensis]|uniref:uncharacterized protein LOC107648682 n=1 Tax=Arachis ipaensis TaxID=130454 RepID=UPI000A2B66E0|nr:uncharacterized protein LOC107648682 [Arachis ipaensis]XP_025628068.1 uncharacterized protein LOC112721217 [Arachis hypogaea]
MDKNTRYFHNLASAHRRNNRIDALMVHGRLVRNQDRIKVAIRDFYKDLYHQEKSPNIGFREGLVKQLDEGEAIELEVMPTVEEIKAAVWNCESSKAPGSDGYNMNFIKKCWEEVGREFIEAVLGFFQTSMLPRDSNVTWVALAPKFTGAREIKDLRPISMVGCVYKVISKVLVRRMRKVMLGLVGETQSAFVMGKKIHDGALIACETVQWLKTRKKSAVIIKLDFQKAYDRVKWSFVDIVLQKMGFGHRWRGMVGEAVRNGRISPLLVGRDNIELSHLQFAILFCPTEEETIRNYKWLLRCFEMMSGLSINFKKSSFIPINSDQRWAHKMCQLLGCTEASLPVRYLGISLGANPRLVKTWQPVIDKLIQVAKDSSGEVDFPPKTLLWSKEDGRNGVPLVKWEVVMAPKKAGGLEVGDAVIRNAALLFKWWWRFSKEDCPLWKKAVCSCNNMSPSEMLCGQLLPTREGPWKDICQLQISEPQVREKMIRGLSMDVGNGRTVRFWEDIWLPNGSLKELFPRLFSISNLKGSVIRDCGFWDGLE